MANFAIIGAALNTAQSRAKYLTLDGADVLKGRGSTSFGVDVESIELTESGPGGTSSLRFVLEDNDKTYTLVEGMRVRYWDITKDAPLFYGFLQSWAPVRYGMGRAIAVECIGVDALLDWIKVRAMTIGSGTDMRTGIQAIAGNVYGVGEPLNVNSNVQSNVTTPVDIITEQASYAVVIADGTTLRDALGQLFDSAGEGLSFGIDSGGGGGSRLTRRPIFWGDMYGGLRVIYDTSVSIGLGDYATITVTGSTSGTTSAGLQYRFDATGVPHQVVITGANAAGSGIVTDGTGLPGPIAQLTDTTSDTDLKKRSIGWGYLAELTSVIRGSLRLEAFTPTLSASGGLNQQRAGGWITITDGQIGLTTQKFRIYQIVKRFNASGTEEWDVTFGGRPPSLMRSVRKLTRSTLS